MILADGVLESDEKEFNNSLTKSSDVHRGQPG